ncbi:hypothetical protein [Moraxella ovis]|uniref:hypothetical protein n=1 Tax=Moraxella ovis TaxID=29433 RepID=UPI000A7005C3|nr:hypothetical protein [Moraxella ovis]
MRKHDCGVALYPPPEVGGFTATEDKDKSKFLAHPKLPKYLDKTKGRANIILPNNQFLNVICKKAF